MSKKIEIPRHIDFKPRKDIAQYFEREGGSIILPDFEKIEKHYENSKPRVLCPVCGKSGWWKIKGNQCWH